MRQVVKLGEALLALLLATLLAMVGLNIVMRYAFGTGISATEELSRTLFVWITFCGAVLASYERTHLGVDSLLDKLPPGARRVGQVLGEGIVLVCCLLVLHGTWRQHAVNASNKSLTTGMPMIWVYGVGYVVGIGIGLITAYRIWTLVAPRPDPDPPPSAQAKAEVAP